MLEDETPKIVEKLGWQRTQLKSFDNRKAIPLNKIITPNQLKKQISTQQIVQSSPRKSINYNNQIILSPKNKNNQIENENNPADQIFMQKLAKQFELESKLCSSRDARRQVANENPELLEKIDATTHYLSEVRQMREQKFNQLQVFDHEVNEIRAKNIYRVELKHGLSRSFLRQKYGQKNSSHEILHHTQKIDKSVAGRLEKLCESIILIGEEEDEEIQEEKRTKLTFQWIKRINMNRTRINSPSNHDGGTSLAPSGMMYQGKRKNSSEIPNLDQISKKNFQIYQKMVLERRKKMLLDLNVGLNEDSNLDDLLVQMKQISEGGVNSLYKKDSTMDDEDLPSVDLVERAAMKKGNRVAALIDAVLEHVDQSQSELNSILEKNSNSNQNSNSNLNSKQKLQNTTQSFRSQNGSRKSKSPQQNLDSDEDEDEKSNHLIQQIQQENNQNSEIQLTENEVNNSEVIDDGIRPRKLQQGQHPLERQNNNNFQYNNQNSIQNSKNNTDFLTNNEKNNQKIEKVLSNFKSKNSFSKIDPSKLTDYIKINQIITKTDDGIKIQPLQNSEIQTQIQFPQLPELELARGISEMDILHARIERIWDILKFPLISKLDMIVKYTSKEFSHFFGPAIQLWENAAACVYKREVLLAHLSQYNQLIEGGDLMEGDLEVVEKAVFDFVVVSQQVQICAGELGEGFGDDLCLEGLSYPGGDPVTIDQLEEFLQRAYCQSHHGLQEELP